MKKNIKKYCLIVIIAFFIICFFSFINFPYKAFSNIDGEIEACNKYLKLDDYDRNEYDKENPGSYTIEKCEYIVSGEGKPISFFDVFDDIIHNFIIGRVFPLLIPVVLMYPIVYSIISEFENGYIKYYLQRNKYSKYIIHLFKDSYKYIWIPIVISYFLLLK